MFCVFQPLSWKKNWNFGLVEFGLLIIEVKFQLKMEERFWREIELMGEDNLEHIQGGICMPVKNFGFTLLVEGPKNSPFQGTQIF
jgi:hypothetical protein